MKKVIFLFSILIIAGCSNILMKKDIPNTPLNNYDVMWDRVDKTYSFFDYKGINWDSVKQVYRPMIHDSIKEDSFFEIINKSLATLRDGHVNVKTYYNYGRNWSWKTDNPGNFNIYTIEKNYLKPNYYRTGPLLNVIIDSVGYVYYGSFGEGITKPQLDYIIDKFSKMKGIIFDVRNNGGGSLATINKIAQRFIDKKYLVAKLYYKNGVKHGDTSKMYPVYFNPEPNLKRFLGKPVVILTNRGSFSAASFFPAMMSAIPNVTLIGDTTGGGGGLPISYVMPNGWDIRCSGTITTLPNGFNFENGMPPDIQATTGIEEDAKDIDAIIVRALEFIKSGK
jgi:C-terminal processing protease CtpA/Prc